MASKKQKLQGKTSQKHKSDPWLNWCTPLPDTKRQKFLEEPEWHWALLDSMCPMGRLDAASLAISNVADSIIPDNDPDLEGHPVPTLESLEVEKFNPEYPYLLDQVMEEQIPGKLEMIREAWPHPKAVGLLKDLARKLVVLLNGAKELGRKKIELARAMTHKDAAAKMEKAYASFCIISLTGDVEVDAERLFLAEKITPERFRAEVRRAFMLDRQATKEINSESQTIRPQSPTTMTDLESLLKKAVANSADAKDAAERAAARILKESKGKRTRTTTVDWELYKYWRKFIRGDLDNMNATVDYDRQTRRSAHEFLETHGNDVFYTSADGMKYTVKERVPTEADVVKMYTRGNKARIRNKAKSGQTE